MLAYVLFRDKGIMPGEYSRMSHAERAILTVFVKKMHADREGQDSVRLIEGGEA